jgi:hypothetical protein
VTPCSLVERFRCFEATCCLYLPDTSDKNNCHILSCKNLRSYLIKCISVYWICLELEAHTDIITSWKPQTCIWTQSECPWVHNCLHTEYLSNDTTQTRYANTSQHWASSDSNTLQSDSRYLLLANFWCFRNGTLSWPCLSV